MVAILLLSSCGKETSPDKPDETITPHEHAWGEGVVTTNPTCKDDGVKTYTCKTCGETKTEVVPKVSNHTWDEGAVTTAATCIADGVKTFTCSVCGETKTEILPKFEHIWDVGIITTAATCTMNGVKTFTCTSCGATKTEAIPMIAHTEVIDAAVPATCTETGLTEGKHCSVCNEVLVAQAVVPAKGHTEVVDAAVPATCTEPGLTEGKHCSVCNEVLIEQTIVSAKGHTEVIDAAVPATCTETGLTEGKHCSVCDTVLVAQTIIPSKGGHVVVIDAAVEPTETKTGLTEGKHCSVCNKVLVAQTVIPAKGYTVTFKDWDGTVLKSQNVKAGRAATAPNSPTRSGYRFTGWDKTFNNINADTTVTAQYIQQFTVTFKDWNGTTLKSQAVDSGSSATAPSNPTRTGYSFTGWDKTFNNVTADLTVTAQYTIKTYMVTFKDYDGTVLKVETVNHGASATAPDSPVRSGYVFKSWDQAFNNITSQLIVTALYDELVVPKIIVNNATVAMNAGTVTVTIELKNNPGISAMQFTVAYDTVLTLKSVTFDPAFGAYVTAPTPYQNPQSVTFISPLAEVSASGIFATLTFDIASVSEQTKADISLTLDTDNTYDENFDEVEFIIVNGVVTIG